MDLSALGSTLPPGLADAERDMGDKFRAAALSITTLYKSSLSSTKQAYHAGYSACLSDVLSTVQSAIAGGQNAEQTLSRLMDWAEAREAAIATFAADEGDEPSPSANAPAQNTQNLMGAGGIGAGTGRRAALAKQALSNFAAQQQQRPCSAPPAGPSASSSLETPLHTTSTVTSTPTTGPSQSWQPTPEHFLSSPATPASSSATRPPLYHVNSGRRQHASPVRTQRADGSAVQPPQSSFNPSLPQLPTAGVPFVSASAPTVPIGSKRPLVDFEMGDESSSPHARGTPSRASKRRSLGSSLIKDEGQDGDKDKDRRKGGRRGHGGAGAGASSI